MKKNIFSIFIVFILLFNNTFTWIVYSVDDIFGELENISEDFDLDDNDFWDWWDVWDDIILPDDFDSDNKDDIKWQYQDLEENVGDNIDLEDNLENIEDWEAVNSESIDDEDIDNWDIEVIDEEIIEEEMSGEIIVEMVDDIKDDDKEIKDEEILDDIQSISDEVQELETQDPSLDIQSNEDYSSIIKIDL